MKYHYRLPPPNAARRLRLRPWPCCSPRRCVAGQCRRCSRACRGGAAAGRQRTGQGRYGPGQGYVTARRREEDSQKVPTPITVLGGETLEAQRISRVQDLQQVLPSVNVAYIHARQSSVAVRGIGNNPASDGLEGSAGIYLDNVTWGGREWPCSTCWTSSNWSCCAVRRALCSARTPPPGC